MDSLGKTLVLVGLLITVTGLIIWALNRGGGGFLPGDIVVQRKHGTFYFPVITCLVISVILSLVSWWMSRR